MAELLVRAKAHWMDDLTQKDVDKMSVEEKQSYEARSQIGDIVVVRPDGWPWGKCECLPDFIVVKVPDLAIEDAQKYEESLMDNSNEEKPKMIRFRKNALAKTDVLLAVDAKTDSVQFTKSVVIGKIAVKTGLASEVSSPKAEEIK